MDITEHLIRRVVFPLWLKKNRSSRGLFAEELEKSQHLPRETVRVRQLERIRSMAQYAYAHCEFYRSKFDAAGFHPAEIDDWSAVGRIPCITKREIQENAESMISDEADRGRLLRDMTGGSTGSPLVFYYDERRRDLREAAAIRHDRWASWDIGRRKAILWGAPQDTHLSGTIAARLREKFVERRVILDAAHLSDTAMDAFATTLSEYNPAVIQAYANTLVHFARYVLEKGGNPIRAGGVITSAEMLTEEGRQIIERAFSCRVFNRYGCREFGVIASECGQGPGMHINAENLLVEVPWPDGDGVGELVISDLVNCSMPMIRYRIEDVGRNLQDDCACGRGLPRMELVGGRVSDFLIGSDGRRVSGIVIATYVITNIPGIRQVQYIQRHSGGVVIRVVKGRQWGSASERELVGRTLAFLGSSMRVEVEYRQEIEREPSGKYRFSVSTIQR